MQLKSVFKVLYSSLADKVSRRCRREGGRASLGGIKGRVGAKWERVGVGKSGDSMGNKFVEYLIKQSNLTQIGRDIVPIYFLSILIYKSS